MIDRMRTMKGTKNGHDKSGETEVGALSIGELVERLDALRRTQRFGAGDQTGFRTPDGRAYDGVAGVIGRDQQRLGGDRVVIELARRSFERPNGKAAESASKPPEVRQDHVLYGAPVNAAGDMATWRSVTANDHEVGDGRDLLLYARHNAALATHEPRLAGTLTEESEERVAAEEAVSIIEGMERQLQSVPRQVRDAAVKRFLVKAVAAWLWTELRLLRHQGGEGFEFHWSWGPRGANAWVDDLPTAAEREEWAAMIGWARRKASARKTGGKVRPARARRRPPARLRQRG
jgi:hypothetical protein